jgi:CheY-like chemotaxis protein
VSEQLDVKRVVLVVEDDPVVRNLLVELLTEEPDLDVVGAVGGTEVLKLLPRRIPHVVLLDLSMPGMDGIELAEWFKADPKTRGIPLIGITALGPSAGARTEALAAGCAVVLDKPIDPDTLLRTIRSVLGG